MRSTLGWMMPITRIPRAGNHVYPGAPLQESRCPRPDSAKPGTSFTPEHLSGRGLICTSGTTLHWLNAQWVSRYGYVASLPLFQLTFPRIGPWGSGECACTSVLCSSSRAGDPSALVREAISRPSLTAVKSERLAIVNA